MEQHQVCQGNIERQQPLRQRLLRVRLDLAIGNMRQPVAIDGDQAPAGRAEARIETQENQPSFSITSSDTS
jgi:hypothetical protein